MSRCLPGALTLREANPPPSALTSLLGEIVKAAEEGNTPLVKDRCDKILGICTLYNPRQSRVLAQSSSSLSTTAGKRIGGLAYRPEYMLHSVLLADELILTEKMRSVLFSFVGVGPPSFTD